VLTARGWALTGAGIALLVMGRVLGIRELLELGVGLATLIVTACIVVRRQRRETRQSRAVLPAEVSPGALVTVEITIAAGRRRSAPLLFVDRLPRGLAGPTGHLGLAGPTEHRGLGGDGQPPADQVLPPGTVSVHSGVGALNPHATHRIRYQLVAAKRGRYEIGPGSVNTTDPFGVARGPRRPVAAGAVVVLPAVETLPPLPVANPATLQGTPLPLAPVGTGEDFFTMRGYLPGDDVKKIHWRSTARQGHMMVRQEDRPSEPRVAILVEDGHDAHVRRSDGADSFESCISSAASLVHLFVSQGVAVGLALSSGIAGGPAAASGPDLAFFGKGAAHERALMRRLAVLAPGAPSPRRAVAAGLRGLLDPHLGANHLIFVTTEGDLDWVLAAAGGATCRGRGGPALPLVVVRHLRDTYLTPVPTPHSWGAGEASPVAGAAALAVQRAGGVMIEVPAGETLRSSLRPEATFPQPGAQRFAHPQAAAGSRQ
jgi:uncharacterized protein (DUF58 family)